jgi:hypothetical protein
MSDKDSSQVQQMMNPWYRAWQEQIERWESAMTELGKVETKGFEQVCANVDEAARLTKESTAYANLLAAQWRKLALDSTRQTFEVFGAR